MLIEEFFPRTSGPIYTAASWSPEEGGLEVHCSRAPLSPSSLAERLDALLDGDDSEIIVIGDVEWIQGRDDGIRAISTRVMLGALAPLESESETASPVAGAIRLRAELDDNRRANIERPIHFRGGPTGDGTWEVEITIGGDAPSTWLAISDSLRLAASSSGELARLRCRGIRPLGPEGFA